MEPRHIPLFHSSTPKPPRREDRHEDANLRAGCCTLDWREAPAQDSYPSRPITIVVPFPAGGPTDALGRILAEPMRVSLGQSVMIENVAGAGSIGVGRVARATPDGYTLSLGHWGTYVTNGAVYSLSYDLAKDFEPIAQVYREAVVIVARKAMPAND